LTHTIEEARKLAEAARRYKVATQMGNQGHAGAGVRNVCEWIWDGAIGNVKEGYQSRGAVPLFLQPQLNPRLHLLGHQEVDSAPPADQIVA
jgi:hypothetical protein